MKPTTKEIKTRFERARKVHADRIDVEIPLPLPPSPQAVYKELQAGKADIDPAELKRAFEADGRNFGPLFIDVITTPAITKWKDGREVAEKRRNLAKAKLDEVCEAFLDRVLFDHESPYLALRDFAKWRDGQPVEERRC